MKTKMTLAALALSLLVGCAGIDFGLSDENRQKLERLEKERQELQKLYDDLKLKIDQIKTKDRFDPKELLPLIERSLDAKRNLDRVYKEMQDVLSEAKKGNWETADWIGYVLVSALTYLGVRTGRRKLESLGRA